MQYIYLHGFASSPRSFKARRFRAYFAPRGIEFWIPDLNEGDFSGLTLSRQIATIEAKIGDRPTAIVGSSLGGLTAAILAERNPNIERLVLLAPAFGFLGHWLPSLDAGKLERWRQTGTTEIFHYGDNCDRALSYEFVRDLERYDSDRDGFLTRPVPTKIVHGIRDDVIPVEASRAYARDRDWVELVEFDSDHTLASHGHPTIVLSYEFLVGRTVEDS
ncbi:MAG: YqiA/YcfP family alpha/beta fold hydrolase [Geitlerinemataceae cyanobacterium]